MIDFSLLVILSKGVGLYNFVVGTLVGTFNGASSPEILRVGGGIGETGFCSQLSDDNGDR